MKLSEVALHTFMNGNRYNKFIDKEHRTIETLDLFLTQYSIKSSWK